MDLTRRVGVVAAFPKVLMDQGLSGFLFASGTRKVHGGYMKYMTRIDLNRNLEYEFFLSHKVIMG